MTPTRRTRASVVCRHEGRLLTVRAVDPVTGQRYLFLPGGAIEPGEAPAKAAERETLEETGYRVGVDAASELVLDYPFCWTGKQIDCRTHFFRASLVDPDAPPATVNDDPYLFGVEWVPADEIETAFAYHDVIRRAVLELFSL